MPRTDSTAVKVGRKHYDELVEVGQKTGLPMRHMMDRAIDLWLETAAPVLVQAAEKTNAKRTR